ncbi:hypothetical protein BJY21_003085 [Kineosphaera limosa]|nr:hypothetical protein [Kineosphaera limosa]
MTSQASSYSWYLQEVLQGTPPAQTCNPLCPRPRLCPSSWAYTPPSAAALIHTVVFHTLANPA